MNLTLPADIQKIIDERVKSGKYSSAEDVVAAGLISLTQQERLADLGPGQLDELLSTADAEIERGELLDGETVFREFRELGKNHQSKAG